MKALFLNGVYENVLEEIVEVQSNIKNLVCYLQPYNAKKIQLLVKEQPSADSRIKLYISTTTNLGNICYTADVVGWENKQEISFNRLEDLNEQIKNHQPSETCIYMEMGNGVKCVNLISILNLKRLVSPFSVGNLIKTNDGTPLKKRSQAGGWSYVEQMEDWVGTTETFFKENLDAELEKSLRDSRESDPVARRKRLASAEKFPQQIQIVSRAYRRNTDVIQEVLLRAKGLCERCKSKAPFSRARDGTPFLEVHHVVMLADGGEDTVDNATALCPNCHRELHFG